MRNHMRHLALLSALACLGTSWGQSQTNVTVQGGQAAPAPRDTVIKVVPKDTSAVPYGNGGSANVPSGTANGSGGTADGSYTPPDTAREVGAIPPNETKVLQTRKEAKHFATAGFGPAGFGNVDERVPAYDLYAGRMWEVNRQAAIKALGEVASDFSRATLANLQLGANLYALPTDVSPYVGADMGLGYGVIPGDRTFGFNVGASVGALLFRTSNAQMNLEGNASTILSQMGDKNEMPMIYTARVGVLF